MQVSKIFSHLMTKHSGKTIAAVLYPTVAAVGLGVAYFTGIPWWGGLIIAFGAMIVVGITAG